SASTHPRDDCGVTPHAGRSTHPQDTSMRGSSPALNSRTLERHAGYATGARMTVEGTINKTGFLLLCMVVPATWMWIQVMEGTGSFDAPSPAVGLGLIGGLIGRLAFALVTVFKPTWAPVTAPLYAICEGFLLGAISAAFEAQVR